MDVTKKNHKRENSIESFIKIWTRNNNNLQSKNEYRIRHNRKPTEDGNTAPFWIDLMQHVFGINDNEYINYEKRVKNGRGNTVWLDGYIKATKVIIEQKRPGVNLGKKEYRRSFKLHNGKVTPFEQAESYNNYLAWGEKAHWIIVCNFNEFWIYDMNQELGDAKKPLFKLKLQDLKDKAYKLNFLVNSNYDENKAKDISQHACNKVMEIRDVLERQYIKTQKFNHVKNINKSKIVRDSNIICMRLVFLYYTDNIGILSENGQKLIFRDFLQNYSASAYSTQLQRLFNEVLDKPHNRRSKNIDPQFNNFRYVDGGLFSEKIELPSFSKEIDGSESLAQSIVSVSDDGIWRDINPTIFGTLFEMNIDEKERRSNGMLYTSVKNIHKVIDPLFLNNLKHELHHIEISSRDGIDLKGRLLKFQNKLGHIKILDPACGSGNFLTDSYICLRQIENRVIHLLINRTTYTSNNVNIKVNINQFYGIELNNFAVSVARTAMWIAYVKEAINTQNIINRDISFLPLDPNTNIIQGNSLRISWTKVLKGNIKSLNYIISNPPFVGSKQQTPQQKHDLKHVLNLDKFKHIGRVDYVMGWFAKSAEMINKNNSIKVALLSTSSIVQGKQAIVLWKPLFNIYNLKIFFAYEPFVWINDVGKQARSINKVSKDKKSKITQAKVYCVVIGFCKNTISTPKKILFSPKLERKNNQLKEVIYPRQVTNINAYLRDMPNFFIHALNAPLDTRALPMYRGCSPVDKGYLSRISDKEKNKICNSYPNATKLFKRVMGAHEFLNNTIRWCLWLKGTEVPVSSWNNIKPICKRVHEVKNARLSSTTSDTRKKAKVPYEFYRTNNPNKKYLIFPKTTTNLRKYIPLGFENKNVIMTDKCFGIPGANLYYFGILSSIVHMDWTRLITGRLGNGLEYSNRLVYDNFPWPVNNKYNSDITKTATNILKARKNDNSTLEQLYNQDKMPVDLRKAHYENDKVVLKAYGLKHNADFHTIVSKLVKMYMTLEKKAKINKLKARKLKKKN